MKLIHRPCPGSNRRLAALLLVATLALDRAAGFDHDVALNPAGHILTGFTPGQNVNLRPRTSNPAGHADGTVKTVTTL